MKNETRVIVLKKGDEIVKSLIEYCDRESIKSAWVSGLGALSDVTLALYQLDSKSYSRSTLKGDYELLMLNGNIGKLEGKTTAHLHATVSDRQMKALGGHLDSAIVAATCELKLEILESEIKRKYDDSIGLNLIQGDSDGQE